MTIGVTDMCDEGPDDAGQASEDEYSLVNSVDALFEPMAWCTPEVHALRNRDGAPLAFIATCTMLGALPMRSELPTEFFSHQLLDLDRSDPDKMAAFMSEYGLVGAQAWTFHDGRAFERDLAALDAADAFAIDAFEERYSYAPKSYPTKFSLDKEGAQIHYEELACSLSNLMAELEAARADDSVASTPMIAGIVSFERARYLLESWVFCAGHIKALVQFHTPRELADALGEGETEVIAACRDAVEFLQTYLQDAHPRLDLMDTTDGQRLTYGSDAGAGGFEQALALQLWNFALEAKEGYTVCRECGQVFVHRQTKARKGSPRNTSVFCCDRCKNRHAQREHRKTEGYRLKQERKSSGV